MADPLSGDEFNLVNQDSDDPNDEEFVDEFDDAWHAELEDALMEGFVDHSIIKNICKCRVLPLSHRAEVWKICLNIASRGNALSSWDEKLDLPEQKEIHTACEDAVKDMDLENTEKIIADLESIITFYCKSRAVKYDKAYAWTDLLLPMVALPELDRADLYNCFYAILARYIPKELHPDGPYNLFRLLLLYHDPELCSFLDSKKVTIQSFMKPWLRTLFSSRCRREVTQALWDVYLQCADPLFMLFLSIVILVNAKEKIIGTMTGSSKAEIIETLTDFPAALETVDVEDFCQLAMYFCDKTPKSLRRSYQDVLFGGPATSTVSEESRLSERELAQALCLPVSVQDILIPAQFSGIYEDDPSESSQVRFFLVDCRSPDLYNAGHLKTAFHLDATLMLREPKEFSTAVEALVNAQEQAINAGSAAGGEHLCLIGSGIEEEDQYMYMAIAHLLKHHRLYVSTLRGGFKAIVNYLSDANINLSEWITGTCTPEKLLKLLESTGHSSSESSETITASSSKTAEPRMMESLMKSFTSKLKTKSQDLKERVTKFIEASDDESLDHVNPAYGSKAYRGTQPVFSIGDEDEQAPSKSTKAPGTSYVPQYEEDSDVDEEQLLDIGDWMSKNKITKSFPCTLFSPDGRHIHIHLVVQGDDLICLRDYKGKGKHKIISSRHLGYVTKITSKRACPELITFRFKYPDDKHGDDGMDTVDRYLIPEAGLATRFIKQHIMRILEPTESDA